MARHRASKRVTLRVMLSSTMKRRRRAVGARVADVVEHAAEVEDVEVAAAHLDDRAEAAVEGAAARGLDHVHLPAQQRVARAARARRGAAGLSSPSSRRRTGAVGVGVEAVALAVGEARRCPQGAAPASRARSSSRKVASPSPRTMKSTAGARRRRRPRAPGWGRSRPPRCARRGRSARTRSMTLKAVRRWKVMTERPTTSGWSSRTAGAHGRAHAPLGQDQVGHRHAVVVRPRSPPAR